MRGTIMRYLGNKTRLLSFINDVIEKNKIHGEVFADLFSGTASVGDYMKGKYKIIGNDFMYYSYVFTQAKITNASEPSFSSFYEKYNCDIFDWLNDRLYTPDENYFVYNNYTPIAERKFFTEENAIKIDGIRQDIEKLYSNKIINKKEYFYLLASLLESVTKVSNTSGTYEAFFKFWDSRSHKDFIISPLEMNNTDNVHEDNISYNEDTNKLVRNISGDIAYIDTPYTITQYASAYHILETIARYDYPEIAGKTGRRQKNKKMSNYSRKKQAKIAFEDMLRQINFNHILISYSNQSLVPLDELVDLCKSFSKDGVVKIEKLPYREYKNLNSSKKGAGSKLNEVIIYFKKDLSLIKSPLNYSGSKDTMLSKIYKELPEHVGTFVDAMGGAFNVGGNVMALDKVIYNEYNPYVYNILKMILETDRDLLVDNIKNIIKKFNLDNKRKEEYIKFRAYYNEKDQSPINLFILHLYSFQNLIRFNSNMKFNTPIGNAGFNDKMEYRIINFKAKTKEVVLSNKSFDELNIDEFDRDTVFYFDPPYLITTAEYNDGKRGLEGWGIYMENKLLDYLDLIDQKGYKFMLSNVIEHRGQKNELLYNWINKNNYTLINVGKTGTRYPRIEVIVKNY